MRPIESIDRPLFVPENRSELTRLPAAALEGVAPEVLAAAARFLEDPTAAGFLEFEETVLRVFQHGASHVVAGVVGLLHRDAGHVQAAVDGAFSGSPRPLRHRGLRATPVRFLGGARLFLDTPYLSEDLRGRPGAKRGVGRRQATGTGRYPVLAALGIAHQATPALASEVARQTVRTGSFEEAHLRQGRVDTVIEAIGSLCRGRLAARIGTELAYFTDRRDLMRYDHFHRCGIPLGSGAVESAIRRVVNLRLKGPSIFWRGRNAERMLHLRCYLKAGRWNELMQRVLFPAHTTLSLPAAGRRAA